MNYVETTVETKLYARYERFKQMVQKHNIKIKRECLSEHTNKPANAGKMTYVKVFRHLMWLCGEEGLIPYDHEKRWAIVEKARWLDADDPYPLYKVLMARRGKKGRPKQTAEV